MQDTDTIENRTFAEIKLRDSASLTRTLGEADTALFALVGGEAGDSLVADGLWGSGLIAAVLGTELPGPGATYLGQSLHFLKPVARGDTVTATVTVAEKHAEGSRLVLDCRCTNQAGEDVITGRAEVIAPTEKLRVARGEVPDVRLATHDHYRALLEQARGSGAVSTAVAHPCSAAAIAAAVEAADEGLIAPILVGPEGKIRAAAQAAGLDIARFRIEPAPHSHAAAARAVELVRKGEAGLLMKGSLHTDELMGAVLSRDTGLRTERRISHAYVMSVAGRAGPLIITDAAINIAPSLKEKADIVRNAIDLAQVIGITEPKVAILAAVETVNPAMQSTLDAAALCKMADRGQIAGGVLDGPLAFDNAISAAAAKEKGIVSPVAGQADVLLVPTLEAGNMLAKQLTFLGQADAAGVVLGARIPIILTSRADSLRTRLASCAVAVLLARAASKAAPGLA